MKIEWNNRLKMLTVNHGGASTTWDFAAFIYQVGGRKALAQALRDTADAVDCAGRAADVETVKETMERR